MSDDLLPASQGRVKEVEREVRHMRKMLDTLGSPLWKRMLFRVDGWPAWYVVATHPRRRFWHRWGYLIDAHGRPFWARG